MIKSQKDVQSIHLQTSCIQGPTDLQTVDQNVSPPTQVGGDIPTRVKRNAHELILDFIRSRPPLKPVSRLRFSRRVPLRETFGPLPVPPGRDKLEVLLPLSPLCFFRLSSPGLGFRAQPPASPSPAAVPPRASAGGDQAGEEAAPGGSALRQA